MFLCKQDHLMSPVIQCGNTLVDSFTMCHCLISKCWPDRLNVLICTTRQTLTAMLSRVQAVLTTLLQPVSKAIQDVQAFREQNRTSPFFNHLSAVSESVPALGWVAMVSDRSVRHFVRVWVNEGMKAGNKPLFDSAIIVSWLAHGQTQQSFTVTVGKINSLCFGCYE